jgi:putative hydrolase of the HAD superfamily
LINTVIFDLDNTLTHRNKSIEKFSALFKKTYDGNLQSQDTTVLNLIREVDGGGYGHKNNPHNSIKHSMASRLKSQLSWTSAPEENELFDFWFNNFPKCSVLMPGAVSLIEWLKKAGFKIAVLSNGHHQSRVKTIEALGLLEHLDRFYSSDLLGVKKPNAQAFQLVAQKIGVNPNQCLFIGDHPLIDVQGAEQAGMKALWLQGFHPWPEHLTPPTRIASHLNDVMNLTELKTLCVN